MAAVGDMPYRTLGRTGERVSLLGLGGYHIGMPVDEREGIAIVRAALDNGVNFLDNAWCYHDGESERRMGKALRDGYRQRVFLMTKIEARSRRVAAPRIRASPGALRRGMDRDTLLDVYQFMVPPRRRRRWSVAVRIPEIHPISDLAREARTLVERARQRQEPIIITQRGRDAAVLVPIELYRRMESLIARRIVSPRLVNPEDAARFRMEMTVIEPPPGKPDAGV